MTLDLEPDSEGTDPGPDRHSVGALAWFQLRRDARWPILAIHIYEEPQRGKHLIARLFSATRVASEDSNLLVRGYGPDL